MHGEQMPAVEGLWQSAAVMQGFPTAVCACAGSHACIHTITWETDGCVLSLLSTFAD